MLVIGFDNVLVLSEMFLKDMAVPATSLADDLTKSTESVLKWPFHKRVVYERFPQSGIWIVIIDNVGSVVTMQFQHPKFPEQTIAAFASEVFRSRIFDVTMLWSCFVVVG